jgi:hypothetical protein
MGHALFLNRRTTNMTCSAPSTRSRSRATHSNAVSFFGPDQVRCRQFGWFSVRFCTSAKAGGRNAVLGKPFQDAGRNTTPSSGSPVVTKRGPPPLGDFPDDIKVVRPISPGSRLRADLHTSCRRPRNLHITGRLPRTRLSGPNEQSATHPVDRAAPALLEGRGYRSPR